MKSLMGKRPSPATILAMLALLVALSGTAIAGKKEKGRIDLVSAPREFWESMPKNVVGSAQITKNAIKASEIRKNAVRTSELAPSSVGNLALQKAAIDAAAIANGAVTASAIAPNAVNQTAIAPNSVNETAIAPNSIISPHIVPGGILTTHLGDGAITSAKIPEDAISSFHLANNSVNSSILAPSAVSTSNIETGAITPRTISQATPAVAATHTASQAVPLEGPVAFNNEVYDSAAMHSGADNSAFIATEPGVYAVSAAVTWDNANAGTRLLVLRKNGVDVAASFIQASGSSTTHTIDSRLKLAAGDTVRLVASLAPDAGCNPLDLPSCSSLQSNPRFSMSWELPG